MTLQISSGRTSLRRRPAAASSAPASADPGAADPTPGTELALIGSPLARTEDATDRSRGRSARTAEPTAPTATARMLAALPVEYFRTLSDRSVTGWRSASLGATLKLDHVVVGPGGVFLVAERPWTGLIDISHGKLRQNGSLRNDQVESVRKAADLVGASIGLEPGTVRAVICLESATVTATHELHGVHVLPLTEARNWLLDAVPVLDADEARDRYERLARSLRPAARSTRTRFSAVPVTDSRQVTAAPLPSAGAATDDHAAAAPEMVELIAQPVPTRREARTARREARTAQREARRSSVGRRRNPVGLAGLVVVAAAAYAAAVLTIHPMVRAVGVTTSALFLACAMLLIRTDLSRSLLSPSSSDSGGTSGGTGLEIVPMAGRVRHRRPAGIPAPPMVSGSVVTVTGARAIGGAPHVGGRLALTAPTRSGELVVVGRHRYKRTH